MINGAGPPYPAGARADAMSTEPVHRDPPSPSTQVRERVVREPADPRTGVRGRAVPGPRPSPGDARACAVPIDRPVCGNRCARNGIRRRGGKCGPAFDRAAERPGGKPLRWDARRHDERRPWRGTPPPVRLTGLPSVHLNPSEWDKPCSTRLPRLVARGYPAAVPGRSVRTTFLRPMHALGNPRGQDLYHRPGRRLRETRRNTERGSTKGLRIGQHTRCVLAVVCRAWTTLQLSCHVVARC